MAFVYQAERDLAIKAGDVPPNIGPGSYIAHKQYEVKLGTVPFDTQVTRCQPIKKDNSPGPGSYNLESNQEGQRVVLQSAQSEVKIVEQKKQLSVFASVTKRFQEQKVLQTPGYSYHQSRPGAYDSEVGVTKPIQQQYTSQNYVETLMKLNKYQSIPSIPTNGQVYGYSEKGVHDLELNKSPHQVFSGLKQDTVGPGQYKLKDVIEVNQNKGTQWHKSKVSRLAPAVSKEKELIVGPGAYDPDAAIIPLYKLNPSGNFQSKSQRMFDQQRGEKSKQIMKMYFEKQKQKLMHYPVFSDLEDEEYEFCEDSTPGPGHYLGNTTTYSFASTNNSESMPKLGNHCFGSKSKRFQERQPINGIGPGDYKVESEIYRQTVSYKNPPFLSTNTRFEHRPIEKKPGPQSYNPRITLEDKLIKKLERAPVGKFGTNQPRFEEQQNDQPGPGTYDQKMKGKEGIASVFKSQTKRDDSQPTKKDNFPAPGAYDVKNYTIELLTKIEKEEDPDLAINKPGFGSSLPRFIEKNKSIEEQEEEEDEEGKMMHSASNLFTKKKAAHPAFNIRENRFQYDKTNQLPGPGEYFDPKQNNWDKKTFNILFSEI